MCTSLIVINNFFKWTRKYKQNNSPHVDDLTDNVRRRRVWWTIRKEVVEEQFEVANDDKLTHPTLSDATWLWYLRLTRNRCNDYIINVTIFLIAENGTIGGAKRRIQRTRGPTWGWVWEWVTPSWLQRFRGVTPKKFLKFYMQVGEFRCTCLITDESHLIISSKSGNRDRNGMRREKRDKTASYSMSKIIRDRHCKKGTVHQKTGWMVTSYIIQIIMHIHKGF